MNTIAFAAIILLLVIVSGCVSQGDPGFKKILNQTKSIVDEAERFRPYDPLQEKPP